MHGLFGWSLSRSIEKAQALSSQGVLLCKTAAHNLGFVPARGAEDLEASIFEPLLAGGSLVYYEEFGDNAAAPDREHQLKGWGPCEERSSDREMNPRWRDLIAEWEEKYGLEFRLDGRIVKRINPPAKVQTKDPSTPVSRAGESAREPSFAQDGRIQ